MIDLRLYKATHTHPSVFQQHKLYLIFFSEKGHRVDWVWNGVVYGKIWGGTVDDQKTFCDIFKQLLKTNGN